MATEWIEWAGGECPVEAGTLVDCKYRDGTFALGLKAQRLNSRVTAGRTKGLIYAAHYAFWVANKLGNDIIAYRVVSA
jgi:hypothetical protein